MDQEGRLWIIKINTCGYLDAHVEMLREYWVAALVEDFLDRILSFNIFIDLFFDLGLKLPFIWAQTRPILNEWSN